MYTGDDYYTLLGVSPTADEIVIRAAYKALLRKYHPDVNPSADASAHTMKLNAAYEILGDLKRRAAYDVARASADREDPDVNRVPSKPAAEPDPTQAAQAVHEAYSQAKPAHPLLLAIGSICAIALCLLLTGVKSGPSGMSAAPAAVAAASIPPAAQSSPSTGIGNLWSKAVGAFEPLETSVTAKIVPNDPACSPDTPLGLVLTNGSGKTITMIDFSWSVRANGYSSELERESSSTDKILHPQENVELCLRKPISADERVVRTVEDGARSPHSFQTPYEKYDESQLVYSVTVDHVSTDPVAS